MHFFCVSAGVVLAVYWLGDFAAGGRFDLAAAAGPEPLDLGDAIYAPNLLQADDGKRRVVRFSWLQEQANPSGVHDYAGCISVPRVLSIEPRTGLLFHEVYLFVWSVSALPSHSLERHPKTTKKNKKRCCPS